MHAAHGRVTHGTRARTWMVIYLKPRRQCPDGLPLSTSLALVQTVRVRRDMSEKVPKIHKYKYAHNKRASPWRANARLRLRACP